MEGYRLNKEMYEGILMELKNKGTFIGRYKYTEKFKKFLMNETRKDQLHPNICVFYGVGGVGKSSLRKLIGRQLATEEPHTLQVHVDFYHPELRTLGGAILYISNCLKKISRIKFRAFEKAYSIYWNKLHSHISLTEKGAFPLLDETDYVGNIVKDLSDTMTAGVGPKAVGFLYKYGNLAIDWYHNKDNLLMKELPYMEPREIEQLLVYFWAQDIRSYLEQEGKSAVFFFDTFEVVQLKNNHRFKGSNTQWIESLIRLVPEIPFVIFGREALEWKSRGINIGYIEEYLVSEFSEGETKKLLQTSGVVERDIQDVIWKASKGLPYYIDIAIDTYKHIKLIKTPQVEDFSEIQGEVLEKFLEYLDPYEIDTLMILSVVRKWDTTLYKELMKQYPTGYTIQSLKSITRFSFIQQNEGSWTMHQLMREGLETKLRDEDEPLFYEIHSFVHHLYEEKVSGKTQMKVTKEDIVNLMESYYHASYCMEIRELVNWLRENSRRFSKNYGNHLIFLYEDLMMKINVLDSCLENQILQAQTLDCLGVLYMNELKYEHAEDLFLRALQIKKERKQELLLSSNYEFDDFYQQIFISYKYLGVISNILGKKNQAEGYYNKALTILETEDGYCIDLGHRISFFNHLGSFFTIQGLFDDAERCLTQAIEIETHTNGTRTDAMASLLWKLGVLSISKGNTPESLGFLNQAREIVEELKENNSLLGWIYHAMGKAYSKNSEAEIYFNRALALLEECYGPESDSVGNVLSDLGTYYLDLGEYNIAKPLYKRSLRNLSRVYSRDHPEVATVLGNLGVCIYQTGGAPSIALNYLKKSLVMSEKLSSEYPLNFAYSLFNLATFYDNEKIELGTTEKYFIRALDIAKTTLREDDEFILKIKKHLALHVFGKGNKDKGTTLLEEVFAIEKKIYNMESLEIANSLYYLGDFYNQNKKFSKAEDCFRRSIALAEKKLPEHHSHLLRCKNSLALSYWAQNKMTKAERLFKEIIELMRLTIGEENPNTLEVVQNLLDFYKRRNKTREYNKLFYEWRKYLI